MSSEFGKILRASVFGQSHGSAIGVLMDGLPAGEEINLQELQAFLDRRRPKADGLSTARKEADIPRFLSGLIFPENQEKTAVTCGFPLCAVLENADQRSGDYAAFQNTPRPGHADYTAFIKWKGFADMRGGGHFSGRLTAPLCVAGGIAKQILARRGIHIGAHLQRVGGVTDTPFPLAPAPSLSAAPDLSVATDLSAAPNLSAVPNLCAGLFAEIAAKSFPVLDDGAGEKMKALIAQARAERDSVGGVVECAAIGFPAGLGDPMFDGVESRLAAVVFGIPAVKGVEFGAGFHAAELRGSENNDPFAVQDNDPSVQNGDPSTVWDRRIVTETNHSGGILGGITTGMPLIFRAAFKPTPSIGKPQKSVNLSAMEAAELQIAGRHDPCVAHRAVPVVEAAAACVLLDMLLEGNHGILP